MSLSLDMVSSLFIYLTALFVVLFDITAAKSGLALVTALQLLLYVPWFFQLLFDLTSTLESVSNLIYFSDHVIKEVSILILGNPNYICGNITRMAKGWRN
jgi:hypothetical protein